MELFGTAGIRGSVVDRVTPELALAVGRAAGADAESEVVVGRDGRTTGDALASAVAAGLQSAGASVRRTGRLPTPALGFASRGRRGVMLTASHNPPQDNGIKLFVDGVEYDADAEREIEERAEASPPPVAWDEWGGAARADVLDAYLDAVVDYARGHGADAADLRAVVDCGNGAAGLATPQVLRDLGCEVTALHANVDGHFPGRPSKPTPETLADARAFLADGDYDFGIAHDGDGDRIVLLDGAGEIVHEDTVVAVLAHHYVAASDAADPVVVTTPNASARIDERVREAGGRVERVRLGALHEGIARVRDEGGSDAEVAFAAEPWKHVHPALGGWIDGVASAAVLARLIAAAGDAAALREPVAERPYRKASVDCPDDRKEEAMARVADLLADRLPDATLDASYGVRAELPDGSWVLVRPSGTEPKLRVYAESERVDELLATATDAVSEAVEGGG